jgi:hypothetical protein
MERETLIKTYYTGQKDSSFFTHTEKRESFSLS